MIKFRILFLIFIIIISISCKDNFVNTKKGYDRIRVGYMADFSGSSSVAIAQEKGFFEEEGLNVELIKFLDGPSEIAAMDAGSIQFAYIGHGAHSLAIQGQANVLFPNALSKSEQIIVGKWSGINSISDFKGKTVATTFGTSMEILLDLALKTSYINREDLNVVDMDIVDIVSSMVNKQVDAVSIQAPYSFEILNSLGDEAYTISTIMDYSDEGVFPSSWVVSPDYQNNNQDIVNRFSKAILKAMDYRSANMDEAIQIVANFNSSSIESVKLEEESAIWLSGNDIKNAYIDGTASKWYKAQQKIFVYAKVITNQVDINNYVQIKYMNDNVFNK